MKADFASAISAVASVLLLAGGVYKMVLKKIEEVNSKKVDDLVFKEVVERIEQRMQAIDEKLGLIFKRFEQHDKRIEEISEKLDGFSERVARMEATLNWFTQNAGRR
ncbi:MAG TPA: hypothetical protein ENF94_01845 [Candidatus Woesearchaeota archaeon]|nr:hypothetical protein [Candidatus Woesearchaeota archaeon]